MRVLDLAGSRPLTILCLGSHSDDIEIGCGGAVLKLMAEHPGSRAHWVVFSADGSRADEAKQSAARFLEGAAQSQVEIHDFKDAHFPYEADIKAEFEILKAAVEPQVVFTHFGGDAHQDHRIISELTWNTFRNHLILEYEVPKFDGDLGRPNFFIELEGAQVTDKVAILMDSFPSQQGKDWFDESVFRGLMRLRGMECRASDGYAEGFFVRKVLL